MFKFLILLFIFLDHMKESNFFFWQKNWIAKDPN